MTSTPATRYTLIGKLHDSQDAAAWEEFTRIYQPLVFRICRSRGLQYADATDVTQEVLAKVSQAIDTFHQRKVSSSFRGWIYRVTQNLVIDFLRRRDRSRLVQADVPIQLTPGPDPSPQESAEFRREYERQIFWIVAQEVRGQVKPPTWQAFWCTEIERKPAAQVAEEMNTSVGAVYVSRSRVIARLRKQVEIRMSETNDTPTSNPRDRQSL